MATDVRWSSKPDRVKAVTVRCCQCFWTSSGSPAAVQVDPEPAPMRYWPTRPTPAARTEPCCASEASPPSSPNAPTSKATGSTAAPRAERPVSFDHERYKDRKVIERSYEQLKQWRGLATRYDKLAVIYRGGAVLRSIILWLRSPIETRPRLTGS